MTLEITGLNAIELVQWEALGIQGEGTFEVAKGAKGWWKEAFQGQGQPCFQEDDEGILLFLLFSPFCSWGQRLRLELLVSRLYIKVGFSIFSMCGLVPSNSVTFVTHIHMIFCKLLA